MSPQFSYGNSSHVECPHRPGEPRGSEHPIPRCPHPLGCPHAPRWPRALSLVPAEPAWNVSLSVRGLQLRLHLTSSVPASFSAALCQHRAGQCEPEAPVYTVTRVSGTGPWGGGTTTPGGLSRGVLTLPRALQPDGSAPRELALLLPVQVLGSCVLVRCPPAPPWCPHPAGANPVPPHPSPSPRSGALTCASPGSSCSAPMVSEAPEPAGGSGVWGVGCGGFPPPSPPLSQSHAGISGCWGWGWRWGWC